MIRRLGIGDEAVLQEVCRRNKSRVPSTEEAARFLSAENVHAWIAEEDDELVGFAYAHELLRIDGETIVFLYEVEVHEPFRRRGHGRALVEEAKRLAGGRTMFVLTDQANEAALRTYTAAAASRNRT